MSEVTIKDQIFLEAVFALGKNFFLQGKYEKARIIFNGLMALHPDAAAPSLAYGESLLMEGKFDAALEHFTTASRQFGEDGVCLLGMARALILLGRTTEAKQTLDAVIHKESPKESRILAVAHSMIEAIDGHV